MNYELTDETIKYDGRTLYRIKALVDMPYHGVKAGDIGGFIEKVENLQGNAWVEDNAKVYGNAQVFGRAEVFDNAKVYGNAMVFGNAEVSDYAEILDTAWVHGDARVFGYAKVHRDNSVYGDTEVSGEVWLSKAEPEVKEDTNDPFVAWLYEFEGYGQRIERLSEDLRDPLDKLMPWLRAAYEVGLNAKK